MQTNSVSRKRYFLTFIDDLSRFSMIYLITNKDEVFSKLKEYFAMTKNNFEKTLKSVKKRQQREIHKSLNRIIYEILWKRRSIQYATFTTTGWRGEKEVQKFDGNKKMPPIWSHPDTQFLGKAAMTANYLKNRFPTKPKSKTQFELWNCWKPDLSSLRIPLEPRRSKRINKGKPPEN